MIETQSNHVHVTPVTLAASANLVVLSCDTCRFYEKHHGEQKGTCHALPPTRMPSGYTHWPETTPRGWCGMHSAREAGVPPAVKEKVHPPQRGDRPKAVGK